MEKIQTFFRKRKRAAAFFLAGAIAAASFLPKIANAIVLDELWNDPRAAATWGNDSPAMQDNVAVWGGKYIQTGLAFNYAVYGFNPNLHPPAVWQAWGDNYWPLGVQTYLTQRQGYGNSDFAMFDGRHTYCSGSHTQAVGIQPGAQAFVDDIRGYRLPDRIYYEASAGKTNPPFNFLMLALACYYPGEYKVAEDASVSSMDPWAACGLVSQIITWLATDGDKSGFQGVPEGADAAAVEAAFQQDLAYYRSSRYYAKCLPTIVTEQLVPDIYNDLFSAPAEGSGAAKAGMTTKLDAYFYDIWWAAYLTSRLTPDWDKQITKTNAIAENKDGEYHAYLDLFTSEAAKIYLNGISFVPYGDWEYAGPDPETGKQHFKSASGELDENGSIGKLCWPDGTIGAFMPVDMTKAKIYAFDTYNMNAAPPAFQRIQTQFTAWCDGDLNIYVTLGDDEPDTGDADVGCKRYEHEENFTATYNVNLLKFDSETGKPLADSHWDVLEKFDASQLDNTDLDRKPDNPGSYKSGLGGLNSTDWGDDEISSNYSGDMGVTESDINKYNWGNDGGTQFERWDDPYADPCMRDENVTGEDGLLYEVDSSGRSSGDPAHTDIKGYIYHKGYCTGHPAPEIEYVDCDCEEECDCDEINQELHDEAWEAWYKEVEKCERLVKEGGFFHCVEPGDAAKKAMEEDRDQFFKDFISLTYEYSASEIKAAKGYILHGIHTDDIPLEWRVVTSSEYKDTGEAKNLNHGASNGQSGISTDEPDKSEGDERTLWTAAKKSLADSLGAVTWMSGSTKKDGETKPAKEESAMEDSLGTNKAIGNLENAATEDAEEDIKTSSEYAGNTGTGRDEDVSTDSSASKESNRAEDIGKVTGASHKADSYEESLESGEDNGTLENGDEKAGRETRLSQPYNVPATRTVENMGWKAAVATASEAEVLEYDGILNNEEDELYMDYDLLQGDEIRLAAASSSNAEPARRTNTGYFPNEKKGIAAFFSSLLNREGGDGEDDGEGGSGGFLRNTITFLKSQANRITSPDSTIVDWTFVVYDHRTEGEIHFNKRDFDLQDDEGTLFDAYAEENGDGALEGAVYGLFAAQDIIHPDTDGDGDTGVVFQKDDLVAIATTDRNGDASFMVITEAPGSVYNYDTGSVEYTDWHGQAPGNLHIERDASAVKEQDIERFIGHNPDGSEIMAGDGKDLADTMEGNGAFHYKLSTNQEYNSGMLENNRVTNNKVDTYREDETTSHYPISDNEQNNGNCWIGRPLILGKYGSSYYIRELSRSEGYELSVYGKDGALDTNREAFEAGGREFTSGTASATALAYDIVNGQTVTFTVSSEGTQNGYIVKAANIPEGAVFNITSWETLWDDSVTHIEPVQHKEPVYANTGDIVIVGGHAWEAQIGDTVEYNGKTFQVNSVKTISHGSQKVTPDNSMKIENAHLDPSLVTASGNVISDINRLFLKNGFRKVVNGSPWISVEVESFTVDAVAAAVNAQVFTDDRYQVFNAMEMMGAYEAGGRRYAAIAYCYRNAKGNTAIYNEADGRIYVKTDITYQAPSSGDMQGFVYRSYLADNCDAVVRNEAGFVTSALVPNERAQGRPEYAASDLESQITFQLKENESFWAYAAGERLLNADGTEVVKTITDYVEVSPTLVQKVTNHEIPYDSYQATRDGAGIYTLTVSQETLDSMASGNIDFRITFQDKTAKIDGEDCSAGWYAFKHGEIGITFPMSIADSYIEPLFLMYPGDQEILQDAGTIKNPIGVLERPIRQKVQIEKDIQTLPETKQVWYCLNCGYENQDGVTACGFCNRARSTEETKSIDYAHDTYAAFHSDNISAERDGGWYETAKDWLGSLLKGNSPDEEPESIGNFRFKAYLKSNLERLYRDEDGHVVWMDRNGNTMTPQYKDTNGDGNYDTFTWKYDTAYGGKTVDFPEKDKVSGDGISDTLAEDAVLLSSNVQKIYTDVEHRTGSMTTSARANNLWDTYADPQDGKRENAGQIEGYTTSERETRSEGDAVVTNASLYSYDGILRDRDRSDYLQDEQNHGYTRLLETQRIQIEDGTELINHEAYNYEKFFDAIRAANTDIWDNDMHSTFTGSSMSNYPGQHWFETFYEKYQLDDTDKDYTLANTDGADKDGTAGGDRDTSFKPFRWIREHVFGDRDGYIQYPAVNNGENMEVVVNTSDQARANANASDAVRQFAVKWYLEDEAAKLMVDNGLGENIAKPDGKIGYDEAVYDMALFEAIAKAYNYLRPFYYYDLDTIYSVEWDSAPGGGADKDYTTLSADERLDDRYYNISSYLPYGVYVIVEQPPMRRDDAVNDWENRSFDIEKPKEVIVPSVYDGPESNNTTDNYETHYNFDAGMLLTDQAKQENYLIRFGEENSANTGNQDDREFVIRAHGHHGDFEVYKYGLDIDRLQASIAAPNGDYRCGGWVITQEVHDPLKDYYENDHRGEAGVEEIQKENGGNDASRYHGFDLDVTANGNGAATANGSSYDGEALRKRFFYGSIAEDDGVADQVLFKDGAVDENNASGMSWHNGVKSTTGELTAYDRKYSAALVPWTMTAPADSHAYSAEDFSGYADVNERNRFYTTMLRVNKTDSETGEYILHDDAIFGLYAASRYNSFAEIEKDARLIEDPDERAKFLMQFKPGDAKFYLQDTVIMGSMEFLEAMKARDITPFKRRTALNESMEAPGHLYSGLVPKGTPVCVESERVSLYDGFGDRTGQMTVWSTRVDIPMDDPETQSRLEYGGQNVGYFKTSQPIGAGVYVLAEIKPPIGYVRSKPVAIEVYSDKTTYYADGDMYAKVDAVRYEANLLDEYPYK